VLEIEYQGEGRRIELPLIGAYQAANALVAAGLVLASGGDSAQTFDAMARLQPVRGRLERAAISRAGAPIYVDYAHTPDALEAAIAALRPHCVGRLIVVFGAGGDRDTGKRPQMGAVVLRRPTLGSSPTTIRAARMPAAIRAAVLAGGAGALREVADRREAIAAAIAEAKAGKDIVLSPARGTNRGSMSVRAKACGAAVR
jgi:UDP-N-acetylmuramoyl-L-alanyl-D-glutamate--2,6-diaminopimelate ligase